MKIKKAVITAAGANQHTLPLQMLVDRDGIQKSALRIIVEEVLTAGVEDICIIIRPGDENAYRQAAGPLRANLSFVEQRSAPGYAQALYCAREFVATDPFLHSVSDHLYLSRSGDSCAKQLADAAQSQQCSISAVQATREANLPFYGAIGGKRASSQPHLYQIERVIEKPTPTEAEQHLIVPGLRSGHYLCFFGMQILTPVIMEILGRKIAETSGPLPLSSGLEELARIERLLAVELKGKRFNLGLKFGLFLTQLAFGLAGQDREEVLAQLLETLALQQDQAKSCPKA